jgi:hypothetical protein
MEPSQLLHEFRGLDADKRKEMALLILPEARDALPEAMVALGNDLDVAGRAEVVAGMLPQGQEATTAVTERILGTLPREQQVDLVADLAQSLSADQQAQATIRIADGLPSGKKAATVVEMLSHSPGRRGERSRRRWAVLFRNPSSSQSGSSW